MKQDDIFSIFILNSLTKHFRPLQQSLNSLSGTPNFNSEMLANCILDENALICQHIEAGQSSNPYSVTPSIGFLSAFAAIQSCPENAHVICTNSKCEMHNTDYCIAPGGKMAGCTIKEACAAYWAAQTKQCDSSHASKALVVNVAASSTPTTPLSDTVFVNGLPYVLDPQWSPSSPSAHIAEIVSNNDDYQHCTCIALSKPFSALSALSAFLISNNVLSLPNNPLQLDPSLLPFIIDTGATCHISPFLSDFSSITPILPHPIKSLGATLLNAVGMGTIDICTASSLVLFWPGLRLWAGPSQA